MIKITYDKGDVIIMLSRKKFFGELISKIMDFYSISESDMGEGIGADGRTGSIRKWRNGNCFPQAQVIDEIINFLNGKIPTMNRTHSECKRAINDIIAKYNLETEFIALENCKDNLYPVKALEICFSNKKNEYTPPTIVKEIDGFVGWTDFLGKCKMVDLTHPIVEKSPHDIAESTVTSNVTSEQTKIEKYEAEIITEAPVTSSGIDFKVSRITSLRLNHGTHLDLPGHLIDARAIVARNKLISEYELRDFIMEAIVLNVKHKTDKFHTAIDKYIDKRKWTLNLNPPDGLDDVLNAISEHLVITEDDLDYDGSLENKAILIYTGLSEYYWDFLAYKSDLSLYCFAPFFNSDLTEHLESSGVKLLGADSYQVENPMINFEKYETVSETAKKTIATAVDDVRHSSNHQILLSRNVLVLENLTGDLRDLKNDKSLLICPPPKFAFGNCDDNSITRACALVFN